MAEIKNTFIKSKMNKDLDDRIVPPGEYRDALNIAISRSEGDDVGALETILGNELYHGESTYNTCIGAYIDRQSKKLYYFVTDYIDSSPSGVDNFAPASAYCAIEMYDANTSEKITLVKGSFLNFSARSQITGVNIIEDLLFWTDNRNQPRKINVITATTFPAVRAGTRATARSTTNPYYTKEDQISVAKYYPWKPISLMNINNLSVGSIGTASTMTNPTEQYYPDGVSAKPDYDPAWPGDADYLSDKFIRLSYRFKFDDNEYSLMAPFTQPCFIPKQMGYFLSDDSEAAFKSTIVDFFENNVTQIIANIEFETLNPKKDLKVKEVEILYKESDGLQVKVIESVEIETVMEAMASNTNPYVFDYKYISTKPYKNLPENQTTRVFDKVPVRALAQEVAGNRIIYGNFFTTQSPPKALDYNVTYANKTSVLSVSQKEYPNHTVKQNRNYQVGFVLADRFGRQSSVILSSNDVSVGDGTYNYGGSTVYIPYKPNSGTSALNWPGYALRTIINSPIPTKSQYNAIGYPGLYKNPNYGVDFIVQNTSGTGYSTGTGIGTTGGTGTGLTVDILTVFAGKIGSLKISDPGTGYTNGDVVTVNGGSNNCELTLTVAEPNPTGWYSYKIVVKQKEQEYYNAYLPGILDGYPYSYIDSATGTNNPLFERRKTANIVLINDNINKIPKDLDQVGPDTTQYRSGTKLFGRVSPINDNNYNYNKQYYPGLVGDTVVSISTLAEANYNDTTATGSDPLAFDINYPEFYQSNTNPSIARLKVQNQIGKTAPDPAVLQYRNTLAVYETEPRESLLDIFWETTSSGLISDLNAAILEGGFLGAVQTNGYTFTLNENTAPGSNAFSGIINVVDGFSNVILSDLSFTLLSVYDAELTNRTEEFWLEGHPGSGTIIDPQGFRIKTSSIAGGQNTDAYFYYGSNAAARTFNMLVQCVYTDPVTSEEYISTVSLSNLLLGNTAPTFITAIACPATIIPVPQPPVAPITTITTPRTFDNNGVVVYTFYAQNGSLCDGDNYTNEILFRQNAQNLLPSMFTIRTDENNPGVCELVMLPYEAVGSESFDCYVQMRDAGGAIKVAYVEVTITEVPLVSVTISSSPYCSPGGTWNIGGDGTGDLRYRVTFSNLVIGETYNVSYNFYNLVNTTASNPAAPCGIPASFVASATSQNYYFDVDYVSSAGGNMSIQATIEDASGINTNTYSTTIFKPAIPAISTCPVGSPCV
jgi:hypothetical protein